MKDYKVWLWQFVQWHCVFLGFTTVIVDVKSKQIKKYKYVKIYVALINLVHIFFILKTLYTSFWLSQIKVINFVTLFSYVFQMTTRVIFGLIVILMRLKRDKQLECFLKEIFKLHLKYFIKYDNIPRDNLWKLWFFNNTILLLQNIYYGIFVYKISNITTFSMVIEYFIIFCLGGIQHIIMIYQAGTLCYLYEYFSVVHFQLQHKMFIKDIIFIYLTLCGLLKQVNNIYSSIIFILQLSFITTISITMFSFSTFVMIYGISGTTYIHILAGIINIMLIIHIIGYYFICYKIGSIEFETTIILLQRIEGEYDQELEQFSINRTSVQIAVDVYGIFVIDFKYLFKIFAQILKYFIILLQIYMQNRKIN
ncbi:uncharacterized protein ACRADG_010478 [Cochliomyia hominivorax]